MTENTETLIPDELLISSALLDGHEISNDTVQKAKHGDIQAINVIAEKYYQNLEFGKALAWYRKSSAKNDPTALNRIADMYYNGEGVPQNHSLAFMTYKKSAEQNDKTSLRKIAELYEKGHGVAQDNRSAYYYNLKASELGDGLAMLNLGNMCKADKEDKNAVLWYQRAVEKGNTQARDEIGELNRRGVWLSLTKQYNISLEKRIIELEKKANPNEYNQILNSIQKSSGDTKRLLSLIEEKDQIIASLKSTNLEKEQKINKLETILKDKEMYIVRKEVYTKELEISKNNELERRIKSLELVVADLKENQYIDEESL